MQATFSDEAAAISEAIAERIGQHKFLVWFRNSSRLILKDDQLTIAVPNAFIGRWIESHFSDEISDAAFTVTGREVRTVISVSADMDIAGSAAAPEKERAKAPPKPAAGPKIGSRLKLVLDDFIVGKGNELAYNAAATIIRSDVSPFNPLFLHGGYGLGKTHLLQGICNGLLAKKPGTRILYLSAEEFMNQFVLALKTKKLEDFRTRFRQLDLLAIDDIHFLASKNSMQSEFLHTFNSIELAGKQIILASDAHPKQIGQLSESLVSRFVSGMVVRIDPPDYETRLKICSGIAVRKKKNIAVEVLEYVAEHVRSNVRELEGAMMKLIASASLTKERLTVELAHRVLDEHVTRTDPLVHVSDIEGSVAAFFGISPADVHSSKKNRTITLARWFCMYIARKHTRMSFPEIGKCMGGKSHATAIVACKNVEKHLSENAEIRWNGPRGNRAAKAREVLSQIEDSLTHRI